MVIRGAQTRRNGHGKYGLLANPTLSSNKAQLSSFGVLTSNQLVDTEFEMTLLQLILGQAIVDQALVEHRTNQAMAQSASNMIRATEARAQRLDHEFASTWQAHPDARLQTPF